MISHGMCLGGTTHNHRKMITAIQATTGKVRGLDSILDDLLTLEALTRGPKDAHVYHPSRWQWRLTLAVEAPVAAAGRLSMADV